MYVRVHAAGQDKLTRCVKLLPSLKRVSNGHNDTTRDTNVGTTNRASSSHNLTIANHCV